MIGVGDTGRVGDRRISLKDSPNIGGSHTECIVRHCVDDCPNGGHRIARTGQQRHCLTLGIVAPLGEHLDDP